MTNEELLAEAKRRYPVGTQFKVAHQPYRSEIVLSHDNHNNLFIINYKGEVHINFLVESRVNRDCASVYGENKWAEIISLPKDIKYDYQLF